VIFMTRIESVDTIRLLAITSVIAIHTSPFSQGTGEYNNLYYYLNILINQSARFAVPFFFVISGYFYGVKILRGYCPIDTAKDMVSRIAIIYLSWCVIYLMPYNLSAISDYGILGPIKVAYWDLLNLIDKPITFLFEGSKSHLWFLVSLMLSIVITALFIHNKRISLLIIISISLFIFGNFAKAYSDTDLGVNIDFNTRNGPFLGLFLFVSGYILAKKEVTRYWFAYGLLILMGGLILHFFETYLLMKEFNISIFQEFVFGTYLMGIGAAIVSLSNHKILCNKWSASLGRMTLGIYASHFIFVDLLQPIDKLINHPLWEVFYVVIVLLLSILFTKVLSMSKLTKRIVE
jgi:surface polysaccharide O-acyltransferase-like enzyme